MVGNGDSMRDESGSNRRCRTGHLVAWSTRVAIATLYLAVHGCDSVGGGAVELSWKLRPASSTLTDKFVDCASEQPNTGPVTQIRLHWRSGEGDAAQERSQAWLCQYNHGVTGFDLPEGTADLWVTPECGESPVVAASSDTYIAPAPVQRSVLRGGTVSLGAVELVVSVSYCKTTPTDANPGAVPCICCFSPPCP